MTRPAPLRECNCPAGLTCDCQDLRSLLYQILTSREYGRMEAEGLAADALGLRWADEQDGYVSPDDLRVWTNPWLRDPLKHPGEGE